MSASFTPSDLQATAIREIKDWFQNRTGEQQVFRVFGYAGSGKTTLTRHAIDELGLDTMVKSADGIVSGAAGVLYAAFTGKAALVMTRKGTPGSTIHSLIYRVSEATAAEIERVEKEIDEIKAKLPTLDPTRPAVRGISAQEPRDPPRRHPQAALRPQRAVDRP
jgi:exodeoxyribonuclease-5